MATTLKEKLEAPAKAKTTERDLELKWGAGTIKRGWVAIPNLLLERQQALELDPVDLNILLVLMKHWWRREDKPYPSKATMASIVGREESTVQRRIRRMEEKGLIKRVTKNWPGDGGQAPNEYDLSGLVARIKEYAKTESKTIKTRKDEDARKRRGHIKKGTESA